MAAAAAALAVAVAAAAAATATVSAKVAVTATPRRPLKTSFSRVKGETAAFRAQRGQVQVKKPSSRNRSLCKKKKKIR